jgi:magnesium and cobalt transporter
MKTDELEPNLSKNSWFKELKNLLLLTPGSETELIDILKVASAKKLLDSGTLKMLEGVFAISKMQVKDIMIPRPQMASLAHDQTLEELLAIITQTSHSRFPVLGNTQDDVIGILIVKDFLKAYANQATEAFDLKKILRPAYFVPESKRLDSLLNEFKANRNHLAVVVDEYGGIAGLVTIEDILEEIVGDIDDEFDVIEEKKILRIADHHYQIHALTPLEEINESLGTYFNDTNSDTIGGLVTLTLGRVPATGDKVTIQGWEITVTKANKRQVLQVELKKL